MVVLAMTSVVRSVVGLAGRVWSTRAVTRVASAVALVVVVVVAVTGLVEVVLVEVAPVVVLAVTPVVLRGGSGGGAWARGRR